MKCQSTAAKKSYLVILTVALFCFFFAACRSAKQAIGNANQASAAKVSAPQTPQVMDNDTLTPTLSLPEMTIALWQQLDDQQHNVWFSPLSLALAMRTVADGAKGETQEQLRRVITDYPTIPSDQVKIADAVFVDPSIPLQADYIARCKARNAELYKQKLLAKDINRWANEHTNGKINHIFDDPMPSNLRMVIANAIWFYAEWADPFPERGTREDTFYLAPRTGQNEPSVIVPLMRKNDYFTYQQTADAQVIKLFYEQPADTAQHRFAMTVVLPREGLSASDLLKHVTPEQFAVWLQPDGNDKVILRLPKIKLSYNRNLTDDLRHIGVTLPFTPAADFSGMSTTPLCIDLVKQSAYLDLNEQGTEAAAVTVAAMKLGAAIGHQSKPIEMTVNRPYLLILQDNTTHTPLFVGIIHNPKQ